MADTHEPLSNGINGDTTIEIEHPVTKPTPTSEDLNARIRSLEELNTKSESRIVELEAEIETLRKDGESDRRAAEAIAKHAAELEGQVVRLEHDFISAMNEGEEMSRENRELKAKVSELEEQLKVRDSLIEELRREKVVVDGEVEEVKAHLQVSEEKVKVMEKKMEELVKKSEESDKLIVGLMEKIGDRDGGVDGAAKRWFDGLLKKEIGVIGGVTAGVVVVVAVGACYLRHSRN